MIDKNKKIAEENNILKSRITDQIQEKETLIKRAIKSDYYAYNTYKEAIKSIENGIICMEECVLVCKSVKEDIKKQYLEIEKSKMNNILKEKSTNLNTNINNEKIKIYNNKILKNIDKEIPEFDIIDKLKNNENNKENLNKKEEINIKKIGESEFEAEIKNKKIFSSITNIKKENHNEINSKKLKNKKKITGKTERLKCLRNFQK